MKTNLLSPDKDPMGAAIADYFNHRKADKLRVFSSTVRGRRNTHESIIPPL